MDFMDDAVSFVSRPRNCGKTLEFMRWLNKMKKQEGVMVGMFSVTMPHGWLGKEEDMSSSQTFAYEVLVPEKLDADGAVEREATLIDAKTGVIKRPTRDGLLMKYAAQILEAGITEETAGDVCITIGHSIANPFRD